MAKRGILKPSSIKTICEQVGSLIDAAAVSPDRWTDVVNELVRLVPGTKAALQVVDPGSQRGTPVVFAGWDEHSAVSYTQYYGSINPWVPTMLGAPTFVPLYSEDRLPASAFHKTEFFNDWLAKAGGADGSTGIKLADANGRFGVAVLHYDVRSAARTNEVASPVMAALAPRMRRALDVNRATDIPASASVGPQGLVSMFTEAALLVTDALRLIDANRAAEALLTTGDPFRVGAGRHLLFADDAVRDTVLTQINNHCTFAAPRPIAAARRASKSSRSGEVEVFVTPIELESSHIGGLQAMFPRKYALILARTRVGSADVDLLSDLRERRLTPAEIRLVMHMDGSEPLSRVAEKLGIGYETARTQLRSAFNKLGVSRQSELIALILRSGGRRRD